MNRMALAKKLESVAEAKESDFTNEETETQEDMFKDDTVDTIEEVEPLFTLTPKAPEIEIKPMTFSQTLGRRSNPFKKRSSTPSKGNPFFLHKYVKCSGYMMLEKNSF